MRKKIGECLVQAGLITEADLQTALAEHKRSGERLGAVLVRMNLATERQIAKALAYQLGFAYVNLSENAADPAAVILIPPGFDGGKPAIERSQGFFGMSCIPAKVGKDTGRVKELLRIVDYCTAPFGSGKRKVARSVSDS